MNDDKTPGHTMVRMGAMVAAFDPVHSAKQTAELLGVCTKTLQNLRVRGGGPEYLRIGARKVGYRASAITRYLDARSFAHTADEATRH